MRTLRSHELTLSHGLSGKSPGRRPRSADAGQPEHSGRRPRCDHHDRERWPESSSLTQPAVILHGDHDEQAADHLRAWSAAHCRPSAGSCPRRRPVLPVLACRPGPGHRRYPPADASRGQRRHIVAGECGQQHDVAGAQPAATAQGGRGRQAGAGGQGHPASNHDPPPAVMASRSPHAQPITPVTARPATRPEASIRPTSVSSRSVIDSVGVAGAEFARNESGARSDAFAVVARPRYPAPSWSAGLGFTGEQPAGGCARGMMGA